ncbi:MAG: hypothetical protein M3P52_05120 [Actinomycetota bacterium]|nr:hypothetical protein [Actinomycetota bacterium]
MNITKKVIITVSGAAVAGILTLGASASAAEPDGGTDGARHRRGEYVCNHQSEISDRLAKVTARIEERIARLTERRAQADEAGKSVAVARIDRHLERLDNLLDRVTTRTTQLPVWVAAHCDPAS